MPESLTGALPEGQMTPPADPVEQIALLMCTRCGVAAPVFRSTRETVIQAMQDTVKWLSLHYQQRHG